ncbi:MULTISPECIES: glycosyltransferase family 4 protein [Sphingobacterium]|uniref:glycosyltransferase family 4 protein n=1 Tax=Sphingobacterium TaxID=28453 RepID=UPI00257F90A9|nr:MULTISPECIES: glycosyltransferase family 4 protein [Sphingobacterium]
MGKRLLVYSDCYIYGGSERLMSFLVQNSVLSKNYEITFAYRAHKQYSSAMESDFGSFKGKIIPLKLVSNDTINHNITKKTNTFLAILIKIVLTSFYYSGFYFLFNSIKFIQLLRHSKPDILHINNGGYPAARTCSQLAIVAKLFGIKNIVYQVNNQARRPKFFGHLINPIVNLCVDNFVTASNLAKANLSENAGFDRDKIVLVKNVVRAKPITSTRDSLLQAYNLPQNLVILVQVAFLTKRKGQINAIKALDRLKDNSDGKRFVLFLIGDGEDRADLGRAVHAMGLHDDVFFLGNRNDYHEFLAIADFVLMPSIQDEDMPLVVIEAMLLNKIIIASNFAGIGEVIEDQYSGILLEPSSPDLDSEIADSIRELVSDDVKRENIIKNVTVAATQFSEENYGRLLLNIYNIR